MTISFRKQKPASPLRLGLLLIVALLINALPIRAGQTFPIVGFHDVVDFRGDLDEDAVTVDRLVGFFEWLRAERWHAISLDDVEAARRGEKPLPERAILITFDDGYRSVYTRVYPLLLAYRIPTVVAIVGQWVDAPMDAEVQYGDRKLPRSRFLSPAEMREMAQSGLVEFASHGYSIHQGILANPQGNQLAAAYARKYTPGRGYESTTEYRQRITGDLTRSRELITKLVGRPPRTMVWPFGRYNEEAVKIVRELGFTFALTLDPEPADLSKPMALSRYLPTGDPKLAEMVSNIRFEDPLPAAVRLVAVDPAALWTGDAAGTDERLGKAIERLRTLGANGVVIDAFETGADGTISATWFPNGQLPVRADLLSRLSWQIESRAGARALVRLPTSLALRTIGDRGKVRALFQDLGVHVPMSGLFIDDAPGLARAGSTTEIANAPWKIRNARDTVKLDSLPPADSLALEAFRTVRYWRPGLRLAVVLEPDGTPLPSAIVDVTFQPIAPNARAVERAARRMQNGDWLSVPTSRRVGLWFTGKNPPTPRDLISATRRFQSLGGTAIGWATDDPVRDLPNAKAVGPTVSSATFPVKF